MIKVTDNFIPVQQRFAEEYNLGKVLNLLGNPEKYIPTINIVGTNGKGSTAFYLSKGLLKKYKKVGLFISPAFQFQNERIQINNEVISDINLKKYLDKIGEYIETYHLTFFEIWTLIMIMYFADNKVDIAVIEAGIGGVKDSTNLMSNQLLTLLASVSIDHTDVLGETIQEILTQKVGIAKDNTNLISSYDNRNMYNLIVELIPTVNVIQAQQVEDKVEYQKSNKGLVKAGLEYFDIYDNSIFGENSPLGRFTILHEDPYFIIDGAHNEDGIIQLVETVKKLNQEFIILFASSTHKDFETNLHELNNSFAQVYITDFNHIKSWDLNMINYKNKVENWKQFLAENKDKNILICGSLYFIPQVFEWYNSN